MTSSGSLFDLTGKTALIVGASSGIGLHTAYTLAQAGAAVVLGARRIERVEAEAAKMRAAGYISHAIALDVTDIDSIAAGWQNSESKLGQPLDILFNNAGILYIEPFVSQQAEQVERIFATNIQGAFFMAQEAARHMQARGAGCIINVASSAGLRAGAHLSSYGSSKAALIHLTRVMALELAGKGVRVNALAPGNIETDMHGQFEEKGFDAGIRKRIPMRRFGTCRDLDGATLLLASSAGSYMTGAVIPVDGGQILSWMER